MSKLRDRENPIGAIGKEMGRETTVVAQAKSKLLRNDHFRYHRDSIEINFREGKLILMGRVPSFYLKQVLQSVLRGLPGVERIDNRVDVVSAHGLSSIGRLDQGDESHE